MTARFHHRIHRPAWTVWCPASPAAIHARRERVEF
jgi:hypothetical protein